MRSDNIASNPKTDRFRALAALSGRTARLKSGRLRVEGPQAVGEAIQYSPQNVRTVFVQAEAAQTPPVKMCIQAAKREGLAIELVSAQVAATVAPGCQGVFAAVNSPAIDQFDVSDMVAGFFEAGAGQVLVLPATQDPGNVGTLIRCADAFGAAAVFLGQDSADALSPKVIRFSAGSVFHVPVCRFPDFEQLVEGLRLQGFVLAGTSLDATVELRPGSEEFTELFTGKSVAWVMGNESKGLSVQQLQACDVTVRIPMNGRAESLNVACAASLCLFSTSEALRD